MGLPPGLVEEHTLRRGHADGGIVHSVQPVKGVFVFDIFGGFVTLIQHTGFLELRVFDQRPVQNNTTVVPIQIVEVQRHPYPMLVEGAT